MVVSSWKVNSVGETWTHCLALTSFVAPQDNSSFPSPATSDDGDGLTSLVPTKLDKVLSDILGLQRSLLALPANFAPMGAQCANGGQARCERGIFSEPPTFTEATRRWYGANF